MRRILDFIKGIIITVWVFAAIVTTVYLIYFNDFSVSQIGDYSIFVVDNERLEPAFKKNDIVIVRKEAENKYNKGDYVFFYIDNARDNVYINYAAITDIDVNDHAEDTFHFGEKDKVSYGFIIGTANKAIVYHKAGVVLRILSSRIGFLFLIILPTLFALVYEIFSIVEEAKEEAKEEARLEREAEKEKREE